MKYNSIYTRWKDIFQRFSGHGIYPKELAFLLDNPLRKFILSPGKLIERLHLSEDSVVLEIGSGPGYFSVEAAKRIPEGYLIFFDIQSEMLKKSMMKLARKKITNAYPVQGDAIELPFKNSIFDVVFLVTVLGEVSNPIECLISINKVLRMGGILSITEMKGDPDLLSQDQISQMAAQYGFKLIEIFSSFKGYTINFKKSLRI